MASTVSLGDRFKSDILAMITSGTSNDVNILLEDGEILANKDVLCARSDYFATMFSNNKDNQVKFVEGETNKVNMVHCTKVIMQKIINYLFSGDMSIHDLNLPDIVKMMNMTSMMMLDDLHSFIKDYVLCSIPESGVNCAYLPDLVNGLMMAENFGQDEIREAIVQELFMSLKDVPHIPDVVQNSDAFKMLPANLVKRILLYEEFTESEDEDEEEDNILLQTTSDKATTTTSEDLAQVVSKRPRENDGDLEEPEYKRRKVSRRKSKRAGLSFPLARVNNRFKEGKYDKRLGRTADVYMAGVIEYIVWEVLEEAGRCSRDFKRDKIRPFDIMLVIRKDEELRALAKRLSFTIPALPDIEEHVRQKDVLCDDTDDEDDGDLTSRWVGDNDRLKTFLYWLSGNECSDEDEKEITDSFNLLCGCFTAEDLLTDVRRSGLFSISEIDNSVLEIITRARKEIKTQDEDEVCYLRMLKEESI